MPASVAVASPAQGTTAKGRCVWCCHWGGRLTDGVPSSKAAGGGKQQPERWSSDTTPPEESSGVATGMHKASNCQGPVRPFPWQR
mmetsp:Transcript_32807/g.90613  ORF Transcript_32807/g.90613 Transcript_32807/m.90613 type:complete len:85 (+) Transcript_32807:694-948(+)